jgi:hypothetical protein
MGPGSSPAFGGVGRDDDGLARAKDNLRLREKIAGSDPLFPVVIYNERHNQNA